MTEEHLQHILNLMAYEFSQTHEISKFEMSERYFRRLLKSKKLRSHFDVDDDGNDFLLGIPLELHKDETLWYKVHIK